VLDVIRRGGVPYPYGEIEHDVIAALMRIRGSRSLTSASWRKLFDGPKTQTSTIWCPHFDHREDRPNSARPCARRSSGQKPQPDSSTTANNYFFDHLVGAGVSSGAGTVKLSGLHSGWEPIGLFRLPLSSQNDSILPAWRWSVKTITALAAKKLGKFLA